MKPDKLLQIRYQTGEGFFKRREKLVFQTREVIGVRVPGIAGEAVFIPKDGDQFGSGFDETAGSQTRLPEERHPVEVARLE